MDDIKFEPKLIAFMCNWCTYGAADLAGVSRLSYPPNIRPIRVMCSTTISPHHIMRAFQSGADGVFIGGCHPGDCHYQTGNYRTLARFVLLKNMMRHMGWEDDRLRLEWISAAEGRKFVQVMNEFTDRIRALGPLNRNHTGDGNGEKD